MSETLKKMIVAETHLASTGQLPATDVPGLEHYVSRVIEADFQKAAALVLAKNEQVDPLHLLRTLLSRGEFLRATSLLSELRMEKNSHAMAIELLLEAARLASFEGRWSDCEALSRSALELDPPGISQLALRQVHATSLLELGQLRESHREIELALTLLKIFPHGNLPIYVAATKCRYLVRSNQLRAAEQGLEILWEKLTTTTLNVDICVVLLRIELELRRTLQQESSYLAFAILLLCRSNGDKLYEALAANELEMNESAFSSWKTVFESAREFQRARLSPMPTPHADGLNVQPEEMNRVRHIVLERQGIVIDVETLTVTRVELSSQHWSMLLVLNTKEISRADFFAKIWGSQKFSTDLHDPVIRRAIYRFRRSTPVELTVTKGGLSLPTAWVVRK